MSIIMPILLPYVSVNDWIHLNLQNSNDNEDCDDSILSNIKISSLLSFNFMVLDIRKYSMVINIKIYY